MPWSNLLQITQVLYIIIITVAEQDKRMPDVTIAVNRGRVRVLESSLKRQPMFKTCSETANTDGPVKRPQYEETH